MDARNDKLAIAFIGHIRDLRKDRLTASASDSSSGIRDNAIRAEIVAAVLDLYDGAGVFLIRDRAVFEEAGPGIEVIRRVFRLFDVEFLKKERDQRRTVIRSDNDVSVRLFPAHLGMAAHRHDDRVWSDTAGLTDHLTGLSVRFAGNRAGIHDIHITGRRILCFHKTFLREEFSDCRSLVGIDFAA